MIDTEEREQKGKDQLEVMSAYNYSLSLLFKHVGFFDFYQYNYHVEDRTDLFWYVDEEHVFQYDMSPARIDSLSSYDFLSELCIPNGIKKSIWKGEELTMVVNGGNEIKFSFFKNNKKIVMGGLL